MNDDELFNKVSKEANDHIDRIIHRKASTEVLELTNRTLDITSSLRERISAIETKDFSTMKDIEIAKNWVWKLLAYIIGALISITIAIIKLFF